MAKSGSLASHRSAASHHSGAARGGGGAASWQPTEAQDEDAETRMTVLERRIRTAVGDGNELVNLNECGLDDQLAKLLVKTLTAAEAEVRKRLRAAKRAKLEADKARAEQEAAQFEAFRPDLNEDDWEKEYRAGCDVHWEDDPYIPAPATAVDSSTGLSIVSSEPPPSYRYTPREQRSNYYQGDAEHARSIKAGRAKILFKKALQRYTLRQKGLIAAAAWAQMDYEEGSAGCHHLLLAGNDMTSRGAAHVGALVKSSVVLLTLALGCNPIGDTGAALLGRALQVTKVLTTLALQDCKITAKGVRHLAAGLACNRSLTRLWLLGNAAGDEGARHLAGALRSCRLEALGLEMNQVRAPGCEALALALTFANCPLAWLRLQHNPLGDGGVHFLASALHENRSLTKLQLRDVGVGSQGCVALAKAIKVHPALLELGLEDNSLTPACTTPLVHAMDASPTLQHLHLDMEHGAVYSRLHTREELDKAFALTLMGMISRKKADGDGANHARQQGVAPGMTHLHRFQKLEDVNRKVNLIFDH